MSDFVILTLVNIKVRKANPEKNCFLQYDKLYIDSKIYVFNEVLGQVVEHSESVRYGDMMSRPGSMMMGGGGGYMMSRPSSRTGSRPASGNNDTAQTSPVLYNEGAGGRGDSAGSGIPRLPPLNKTHSMSLPSMSAMEYVDPRCCLRCQV